MSIDTNILLPAVETKNGHHVKAAAFLESINARGDVAISELALVELYVLLRNPAVLGKPLTPADAVMVCDEFRRHPAWQIIGFPSDSRAFHDAYWPRLAARDFARRRAYAYRLALTLIRQGVQDFATVSVEDFEGFGFQRVWNPLER
ncbi:MAG TPA: hypothetical protein VK548_21870 [Candidatus Acidoferrum sp.]|nr:hypothetical protein [Candidatus Acidoferrum sp.]